MAIFKVVSCTKVGEFTGQYGLNYKYLLMLEGQPAGAELNQKPETPVPAPGTEIEGELTNTQYGLKFKKAQKVFTGGAYTGPKKSPETPEKQGSIERQNALTNAVNFCVSKANLLEQPEAVKYLTGKQIIEVATYFKMYNEGKVSIVMTPTEVAAKFGYPPITPEAVAEVFPGAQVQPALPVAPVGPVGVVPPAVTTAPIEQTTYVEGTPENGQFPYDR